MVAISAGKTTTDDRKLNLSKDSVLWNVLTNVGKRDINEVCCIPELELYFNDLYYTKTRYLDRDKVLREDPELQEYIAGILNNILDILPHFISGVRFYGIPVIRNKSKEPWDISVLQDLFTED